MLGEHVENGRVDSGDAIHPIAYFEEQLGTFSEVPFTTRDQPLKALEIRRGCLSGTHRTMLTPEKSVVGQVSRVSRWLGVLRSCVVDSTDRRSSEPSYPDFEGSARVD